MLTRLLSTEARATTGPTASLSQSAEWLNQLLGGGASPSGRNVTADNALTIGALYSALRLLSSAVGQTPLHVLKKADGRRVPQRDHRLWSLLNDSPNPWQTAIEFRETMTTWSVLHGNAVAFIEMTKGGEITGLIPMDPRQVDFLLTPDGKSMVYRYRTQSGAAEYIPRHHVLHIRGPMGNRWVGYGLLTLARDALGLAMVAEEHAARFYGNAAAPLGVLTHPKTIKDETFKRLKQQWDSRHAGTENAYKTAILEDGLKWDPISMNLKDQQFLETRTFQVQEVARWVGIPPHLIGELSRSTNNNIEAQGIEFVTYTTGPWFIRWEQRMWLDLLSPSEQKVLYFKHRADAFLRGQTLQRYQAYNIGRNGGWLSPNDILALEDRDPIPGGDVYLAPMNMVPLTALATGEDEPDAGDDDTPPPAAGGVPTVPGGTRAAAIQRRADLLRPAFEPILLDVVTRAGTRFAGAWDKWHARGAPPTEAELAPHIEWCERLLAPVAAGFARGVVQDTPLPEGYRGQLQSDSAARAIAAEWRDRLRAGTAPTADTSAATVARAFVVMAQQIVGPLLFPTSNFEA
jgi:HK97 family phage portal protein